MLPPKTQHANIQSQVAAAARRHGYSTTEEHRGNGWRADVLAARPPKKIAFEIQLSTQSLKRTIHRQERYVADGITCCWLFERPVAKLADERPDLPLFYVSQASAGRYVVSLSGRAELDLGDFVESFLRDEVRFSQTVRAKVDQSLALIFFRMDCWKCHAPNHVYFVEGTLRAACNAIVRPDEGLWDSSQVKYLPEVVDAAEVLVASVGHPPLHLAQVKTRFSHTVGDSYVSFGCRQCDAIFGDWYVMEQELDAANGYGDPIRLETSIRLRVPIVLPVPHWCYPAGGPFCDDTVVATAGA